MSALKADMVGRAAWPSAPALPIPSPTLAVARMGHPRSRTEDMPALLLAMPPAALLFYVRTTPTTRLRLWLANRRRTPSAASSARFAATLRIPLEFEREMPDTVETGAEGSSRRPR